MQVHATIADLRAALDPERASGRRIAFVPTMGNLHDGHIALARQAEAAGFGKGLPGGGLPGLGGGLPGLPGGMKLPGLGGGLPGQAKKK